LDKHCVFHGELRNKELDVFFNKSNVGVAYVPITDYYNCQPMTKLFEYLLAGMACIATYTEENMKIVNRNNGVLCYDTPTSFSNAIEELWCNRFLFNSKIIKQDAYSYTWQNIIEKQLIHILNNTKK
jgi:glycosyltransferase involved in cell wall biosynthesis